MPGWSQVALRIATSLAKSFDCNVSTNSLNRNALAFGMRLWRQDVLSKRLVQFDQMVILCESLIESQSAWGEDSLVAQTVSIITY